MGKNLENEETLKHVKKEFDTSFWAKWFVPRLFWGQLLSGQAIGTWPFWIEQWTYIFMLKVKKYFRNKGKTTLVYFKTNQLMQNLQPQQVMENHVCGAVKHSRQTWSSLTILSMSKLIVSTLLFPDSSKKLVFTVKYPSQTGRLIIYQSWFFSIYLLMNW